MLNCELMEKTDAIADLQKQVKDATKVNEPSPGTTEKIHKLESTVDNYKTALTDSETIVGELNVSLKELQTQIIEKDQELEAAKTTETNLEMKLKQMTEGLKSAEERLDEEHKNLIKYKDMVNSVDEAGKTDTTSDLCTKLTQTPEEVTKLKSELKQSTEEREDIQSQLDDYIFKFNEKVVEVGNLEDDLQTEKTDKQKMKANNMELEMMVMSLRKELEEEKKKRRQKLHSETRRSVEQNRVKLDQMEKLMNDKNVNSSKHGALVHQHSWNYVIDIQ